MLRKRIDQEMNSALVRYWMDSLGGDVTTGACKLKSVKISKKGKRLTIVLKKKKRRAS